jgi:hypothetical protein
MMPLCRYFGIAYYVCCIVFEDMNEENGMLFMMLQIKNLLKNSCNLPAF